MTVKYNFKLKPFAHQEAALRNGMQRKEFGYFMEMGTGKSKVLIDNMGMLYLDDVPYRVIRWVSSANKKQQEEMRSVKDKFDGLTIFVMNIEAFSTLKGQKAGEWMARALGANGLVAVDESTTIKNHYKKSARHICADRVPQTLSLGPRIFLHIPG